MITPKQFLDFATYNRLFTYITVTPEIAEWLRTDGKDVCVVEDDNTVWYPIISWTIEKTRRESVNRTMFEKKPPQDLTIELMKAIGRQDTKEIVRLSKILGQVK